MPDADASYSPIPGVPTTGLPPVQPGPLSAEHGGFGWATPHPGQASVGWTAPPAPALPGWAPYAAPPPFAPHLAPPPSSTILSAHGRRRRRRVWPFVLGTAGLVVVALAVVGIVGLSRYRSSTQVISDPTHRVSVTVPGSWSDMTGPDAGKHVDQGEDSYDVPDLEAESGYFSDDYLTVYLHAGAGTGAAQTEHAAAVKDLCADDGCLDKGPIEALQVNGLPALEQRLTHPYDGSSFLLTVSSPTLTVTAEMAQWDDESTPEHEAELRKILESVRVSV